MLEGMEPQVKKQSCKVRTVLESLDAKDKEILIQALENTQWSANALAKELTSRGIQISEKPVMAHKTKGCSCAR
jgi:DNA-binding HxlR family transcriptional regulator